MSNGWDVVSEYASLYPDAIRRYDRTVQAPGFTDDMMAAAVEPEKELPKVAQKPLSPAKKRGSDRKKEKIIIDKSPAPPYSDIHDTLRGLPETERAVAELIGENEILVDELIAKAGLPAGSVLSTLTMLEIKGVVRRMPGKRVAIKK